jgi:hypothetical protein
MDAKSCRRKSLGKRYSNNMKPLMLLSIVATLLLGACASFIHTDEIVTETPSHDTVVRDQIPAEGSRKIPVVQQY